MSENPLHLLMNPQSIAVVGANNIPTKMGTIQALSILKDGYKGKFFPLHPKEKTVLGFKTYASPEDLPEVPDLAMLIVPVKTVIPLIESFGKIGTKRAIIITAGFKETGADGRKMENELNEVAERYGMRFVGPNCMGIINSQIFLEHNRLAYARRTRSAWFCLPKRHLCYTIPSGFEKKRHSFQQSD